MAEFPKIQFASVDSNVLLLTNLENTNLAEAEFTKGQHRLGVFKKVSGSLSASNTTTDGEGENEDTGRLITSMVAYTGSSFHHLTLSNFLTDAVIGKYKFAKLPALPAVKTRSKKNEETERTKRQRYLERQARASQKEQESSSSQYRQQTTTDGAFTKDQRKAERDRLREEHRKKNNVRDLTPEEILDRERARRQRMEEEAANWNMLPEDAPPEGEYFGEEEEDYDTSDEGGVENMVAEEDEEEVMDLDG